MEPNLKDLKCKLMELSSYVVQAIPEDSDIKNEIIVRLIDIGADVNYISLPGCDCGDNTCDRGETSGNNWPKQNIDKFFPHVFQAHNTWKQTK